MEIDFAPKDEEELSKIVRDCASEGSRLRISGGGSRLALGQTVSADRGLTTKAISGVVHYDPGALSLVVKAGTTLSELNMILDEAGQRLAFEPIDHRKLLGTQEAEPTVGGMVACGISGPRRIRVGACRDSLLGVRFVNGKGEVIKNGGQVMKNVTGYDLVKLLCGSYGTLGVLTELSLKTSPKPESEGTFTVAGFDDWTAVQFMAKALGAPLDITGAAHLPGEIPKTYLRVEGLTAFVQNRLNTLLALFRNFPDNTGATVSDIPGEESREFWVRIRDIQTFSKEEGDIWRISLKPSDGPLFMADIKKVMDVEHYYDWGGGLVWMRVQSTDSETASQIRNVLARYGGHATLVRASEEVRSRVPVFQPEAPVIAKLGQRLRQQFDPHNILNPGLLELGRGV